MWTLFVAFLMRKSPLSRNLMGLHFGQRNENKSPRVCQGFETPQSFTVRVCWIWIEKGNLKSDSNSVAIDIRWSINYVTWTCFKAIHLVQKSSFYNHYVLHEWPLKHPLERSSMRSSTFMVGYVSELLGNRVRLLEKPNWSYLPIHLHTVIQHCIYLTIADQISQQTGEGKQERDIAFSNLRSILKVYLTLFVKQPRTWILSEIMPHVISDCSQECCLLL